MKRYGMPNEEKPWNMDDAFCERINERLNDFDKASALGDQYGRYRILHVIFMDTHFKYLDQVDGVNLKFQKIKNMFKNHSPSLDKRIQAQHQSVVFSAVEDEIDKLGFDIMKLLYDNDLINLKKNISPNPEVEFVRDYS